MSELFQCEGEVIVQWMTKSPWTCGVAQVEWLSWSHLSVIREVWIWGKHSVYTHFRKDRSIARSARGTQRTLHIDGMRMDVNDRVRAAVQPMWCDEWIKQSRSTRQSVQVVNLETIINMQCWCMSMCVAMDSVVIRPKLKLVSPMLKGVSISCCSTTFNVMPFTLSHLFVNLAKLSVRYSLYRLHHSTPAAGHCKEHGIAERAVRRVKEGTSAVLLQSGRNESWWADSIECNTYLRNVTRHRFNYMMGKTPYKRRFGQPFNGPIIPFGSLVEYYPISAKDQSRIHQFGKKVYAGRIWKGDILVADIEELETLDASEVDSNRLNAKEVMFPKENGTFIFPAADGRIKLPGRDQGLRTSTLIRHRPIRGEGLVDFPWRIRRVSSTPSRLTSGCRWSDKWFLVHDRKLHIPPSRWTQSQTLLAERRIIPYSTEMHWCLQNYKHEFGCYARTPHRWLLECRWIKRFVWFLDRLLSLLFWKRHFQRDKCVREKDWQNGR